MSTTKSKVSPDSELSFTSLIELEKSQYEEEEEDESEEELKWGTNSPELLHAFCDNDVLKLSTTVSSSSSSTSSTVIKQEVTMTKKQESFEKVVEKQEIVEKVEMQETNAVAASAAVCEKINAKAKRSKTDPEALKDLKEAKVFAKVCVRELRRSFSGEFLTSTNIYYSRSASVGAIEKSSFSKFDKLDKSGKQQVELLCKVCAGQVFLVELIKAEKAVFHKNCFRCIECQKQLGVDNYSSHEGKLYCKPHHRSLLQPKPIAEPQEQEQRPKPVLIIKENEPESLPPDVVRACDSNTSNGLEELEVDVKSKFEMFENMRENKSEVELEKVNVKRSPSVLAKLARYESNQNGIENSEIGEFVESEEDEDATKSEMKRKLKTPTAALAEIMQLKQMQEVKAKWESGAASSDVNEQKKNDSARFRSRLCAGKSSNLKELYEKGEFSNTEEKMEENLEIPVDPEKSKKIRNLFESGQVECDSSKISQIEQDSDVFESAVAKESRNIFKELDSKAKACEEWVKLEKPKAKLKEFKPVANNNTEIVKCSEGKEDVVVKTEELESKFRFFENMKEVRERKVFRMTPPREEDGVVSGGGDEEPYRDPSIISSSTPEPELIKSKTTSKMLSVFRQLEEDEKQEKVKAPRPLKEFTPPRDPKEALRVNTVESEEEEEEFEEEEVVDGEVNEKDAFLKEVGSLARARSLRARFEKWEASENAKNTPKQEFDSGDSLESAHILRERFEQLQMQQEAERNKVKDVKVKRFVVRKEKNTAAGDGE